MTVVSKYIRLGLPNEMTTFIDGLIEHLEELYWYEPVRLAHDADIEADIARTIREWLADSQLYHEVKSKVPLFNIASVNHEKLDEIDILVDITHPFRMRVIIEADQARADQLSKKFVSRLSLTSPDSLLYIAFCYPGKSENRSEAEKYLGVFMKEVAMRMGVAGYAGLISIMPYSE